MKKYLVVSMYEDGTESVMLADANTIIRRIDMEDCTGEMMEIYKVQFGGQPKELYIHGCWHDMNNPLYIKVTDENGNIEFSGYGTDH